MNLILLSLTLCSISYIAAMELTPVLEEFKFKQDVAAFREILRVPLTDGFHKNHIAQIPDPDRRILSLDMSKFVIQTYAAQWAKYTNQGTLNVGPVQDMYMYLLKLNFIYSQEKSFPAPLKKDETHGNRYVLQRLTNLSQLENEAKFFKGIKELINPELHRKFEDLLNFLLIIAQPDIHDITPVITAMSKSHHPAAHIEPKQRLTPVLKKADSENKLDQKQEVPDPQAFNKTLKLWKVRSQTK